MTAEEHLARAEELLVKANQYSDASIYAEATAHACVATALLVERGRRTPRLD